MSRYCGNQDAAPILRAAEHWQTNALRRDASVFTEGPVWTIENLRELDRHFIQNIDEGNPDVIGEK